MNKRIEKKEERFSLFSSLFDNISLIHCQQEKAKKNIISLGSANKETLPIIYKKLLIKHHQRKNTHKKESYLFSEYKLRHTIYITIPFRILYVMLPFQLISVLYISLNTIVINDHRNLYIKYKKSS